MIGFCEKCDKKKTCTELCNLCEDYVSQDHVPIEEGLVSINIENRENGVDWGFVDINEETPKRFVRARHRATIIGLHKDGKSVKDILYHVPYSQSQIYEIIEKYKKDSDNS